MNNPLPETPHRQSISLWKKYVVLPLAGQIKQGVTPDKIAESMAWGAVIGVFPILGTTTTLCGIAAVYLRLNHIAIQVVNWLVYPVQILLILPFLELGNIIFGIPPVSLSLSDLIATFEADFLGAVKELGWLALRGIAVWIILAVPSAFILTQILKPISRNLTNKVKRK